MKTPQQQKAAGVARESIVGDNACTMCLYNIPRASLMITVPALVILVSGAAMTAFIDHDQSWTDGLAMIALVCLVLGGAWTVCGLVFWLIAWWRLKPRKPRSHRVRSNLVSTGHDNQAVQLEAVISRECDAATVKPVTSSVGSDHTYDIKTNADQIHVHDSVPDDVIYSVT